MNKKRRINIYFGVLNAGILTNISAETWAPTYQPQ